MAQKPNSQIHVGGAKDINVKLKALGWNEYFENQVLSLKIRNATPVRITQIHRNNLQVVGINLDHKIPSIAQVTVGDWLLLDLENPRSSKILKRKSLLKRRAAGHDRKKQLIAANLDTVFIVSSCNNEFNLARLERYVAMTYEAALTPVIVLTKIDLEPNYEKFVLQASTISNDITVLKLDARNSSAKKFLAPWCRLGQTIAFLGSSGVGKSTLANTLAGNQLIGTQATRASDARGRHTTTSRQLHIISRGCTVIDTPGMRELQLTDAAIGIKETFADLHNLKKSCHFTNCSHNHEPGCAIQHNIINGKIDEKRVNRWLKLIEEDQKNTGSPAKRNTGYNVTKKLDRSKPKHKKK